MKNPKTIKGYVSLLKKVERVSHSTLKGYEQLSQEQKNLINFMSGEIGNIVSEFESATPKE